MEGTIGSLGTYGGDAVKVVLAPGKLVCPVCELGLDVVAVSPSSRQVHLRCPNGHVVLGIT